MSHSEANEFVVREQCQQRVAGANLVGVVFDGGDGPRFGEHLDQLRAEGWAVGVAGLEAVEAALQFGGEARFVDAILLEDVGDVVVGAVDCLYQVMLDFDVVGGTTSVFSVSSGLSLGTPTYISATQINVPYVATGTGTQTLEVETIAGSVEVSIYVI